MDRQQHTAIVLHSDLQARSAVVAVNLGGILRVYGHFHMG